MKPSELIKELERAIEGHGDLNVCHHNAMYGDIDYVDVIDEEITLFPS